MPICQCDWRSQRAARQLKSWRYRRTVSLIRYWPGPAARANRSTTPATFTPLIKGVSWISRNTVAHQPETKSRPTPDAIQTLGGAGGARTRGQWICKTSAWPSRSMLNGAARQDNRQFQAPAPTNRSWTNPGHSWSTNGDRIEAPAPVSTPKREATTGSGRRRRLLATAHLEHGMATSQILPASRFNGGR
jgi:hypothetical protein